jgi:hypothetical protein
MIAALVRVCCAFAFFAAAASQARAEAALRRLLILDFEIVDTSNEPGDCASCRISSLRNLRFAKFSS